MSLALLYGALTIGGLLAAARSTGRARIGWAVIAAGCLVACADKTVDVQLRLWAAGRAAVLFTERVLSLEGHRAALRIVFALALLAASLAALGAAALFTRPLGAARLVALTGLAGLLLLIGLRVVPPIGRLVARPLALAIEWTSGVLVAAGEWMALRRR